MPFRLQPAPLDLNSVKATQWLSMEFIRFETYIMQRLNATLYEAAPILPEEGMIVRADGTLWNPGSGAGFYGYHDGTWVYLG